jgi:hypothetical protein
LVPLLTAAQVQAFFSVSETRASCAISAYLIYSSLTEELTEALNANLWARLDAANYADDGNINV